MIRVKLELICDNPYQTRTQYQNLDELAASIYAMRSVMPETSGLIQVPPARLYDLGSRRVLDPDSVTPDSVVQLAAGHRRFRAFQLLARQYDEYKTFPVELVAYTDEQMADVAWTENHDREDLSAIEEAEAIRRDMETFGWTQAEVATRRGLSRSAVANKLRLLNLPDTAQTAIRSGQLTERHGRALLRAQALSKELYDDLADAIIPISVEKEIEERARELYDGSMFSYTSDCEHACAACGAPAKYHSIATSTSLCTACYRAASEWTPPGVAETERELEHLIRVHSRRIWFPIEARIGDKPTTSRFPVVIVRHVQCIACTALHTEGDNHYCVDRACFQIKTDLWQNYLQWKCAQNMRLLYPDCEVRITFDGFVNMLLDNDINRQLIENGCNPRCGHFWLKYWSPTDGYIALTEDQFVASCESYKHYAACVRKLANSGLLHNDRLQCEKLANDIRRRAVISIRDAIQRAIVPGNEKLLRCLVRLMGETDNDISLSIAQYIADREHTVFAVYPGCCWDNEQLDAYRQRISAWLGEHGLKLPQTVDDLIERIERIERFVQDHDLTHEQIRGNLANLDRIENDLIEQSLTLKTLSMGDYHRLHTRITNLREHLSHVSKETENVTVNELDAV